MNMRIKIFIFLLMGSCCLFSKPRIIDIARELTSSRFIGLVEIQEYYGEKDSILCNEKEDSSKYIHKIRLKAILNDSTFYTTTYKSENLYPLYGYTADLGDDTYTGSWPKQKDTVLVIVDSLNNISLFGYIIDDTFLIWSPYLTESLASFRFQKSTEFVCHNCEDCFEIPTKRMSCRDKCLLPTKVIPDKFLRFIKGNADSLYSVQVFNLSKNNSNFKLQ